MDGQKVKGRGGGVQHQKIKFLSFLASYLDNRLELRDNEPILETPKLGLQHMAKLRNFIFLMLDPPPSPLK